MGGKLHIGKKIHIIRELCGLKQEALASKIGLSQQAVSKIEQRSYITDALLNKIAAAIDVPINAIKNFDEEILIQLIKNDFKVPSQDSTPIDKVTVLYEALLKSEREKVSSLERLVKQMDRQLNEHKNQLMEAPMIAW